MDGEDSDVSDFEIVEKAIPGASSSPHLPMDPLAPPAPLPDFVICDGPKPELIPTTLSVKDNVTVTKPMATEGSGTVGDLKDMNIGASAEPRVTEVGGHKIVEEEEKNEPTMSSIFSWVKSAIPMPTGMPGKDMMDDIMDKISERAKTTMDSVITTLDPQMKEIINTGGSCEIIVTSVNEAKVSGIRQAFQDVFGKATVRGLKSRCNSVAPQALGLISATQAAIEKEAYLRSSGLVHHQQPVLSVEDFLLEIVKDKWYVLNLLYLSDPSRNITLQALSQPVEVPASALTRCRQSNVADFKLASTGYAMTVGHAVAQEFGCAPSDWYTEVCGLEKKEIISPAVRSLAHMYKKAVDKM